GARFSANIGEKSYTAVDRGFPYPMEFRAPEIGTLYFSNPALLNAVLEAGGGAGTMLNGYVYFASTQIWERASLVLSNSTLGIPSDYRWVITNQMQLATGGVVMAPYSALAVGGDVAMTQGAIWRVYAGETNAVRTPAGSYVDVGGALVLASNCWIHPFSHSTNGGSVRFRLGQLTIQPGGGIDASGRGYARQRGETSEVIRQ
ncbi:MAG TPA: hypothetical protein PKW66_29215, partial [Polyangiaceae bacterium]|nr:hypothetical protein [Polyangiaceae bacterium]